MKIKNFVLLAILFAMTFLPVLAVAGEKPIHTQERTLLAAAPLCAEHLGVFKIRVMGDASYRLICEDGERIKIRITVVPGRGAGEDKAFLVLASR